MSAYARKLRARVRRLKGERAALRVDLSNTKQVLAAAFASLQANYDDPRDADAALASLQANYDDLSARHTNLQRAHADAELEIARIPALEQSLAAERLVSRRVPGLDATTGNLLDKNAAQASRIGQLERELDQLKRDGYAPNGWLLLRGVAGTIAGTALCGRVAVLPEPVATQADTALLDNRWPPPPAGTMVGPVVAAAAAIVPGTPTPSYLPRDAAAAQGATSP